MADIEIRIRSPEQLVDSLDPAPFYDKALDRAAERYLLECAEDLSAARTLRVVVHAPATFPAREAEIAAVIHGHFRREHALAERRLRLRMRLGRRTLLLGALVLIVALALRELLLPRVGHAAVAAVLSEGLLILGWVALWRPMETVLYERSDLGQKHAALARLARVPVTLVAAPGG
jgi:hypothetical protein